MSQSNLTKTSAVLWGALFLLAHLYLPGAPLLTKTQKSMAISAIEQNPEVLDAAIVRAEERCSESGYSGLPQDLRIQSQESC